MLITIIIIILSIYLPPKIIISTLKWLFPYIVFTGKVSRNHKSNNDNQNIIAITMDDIPYRTDYTGFTDMKRLKQLFDILDNYDIKITLFMMGSTKTVTDMEKGQFVRAIKSGHLLANHGVHDICHAKLNDHHIEQEILKCDELINDLYRATHKPKSNINFYRPGCGWVTPSIINICSNLNKIIVLGNIYPHDPFVIIPYINYLYIRFKLEHNAIIIIHDRPWTLKMLEYLLPYLKRNNYKMVTLDNMNIN